MSYFKAKFDNHGTTVQSAAARRQACRLPRETASYDTHMVLAIRLLSP